ncbi:MAG: CRISPR-associated endonuclease Cas2 [Planctomycetota bacterium]|jgi:CRISPR-associated endonuclease Cas2|nr:CRISPR-associated endonuclease Cas2 [Planctomycetota bacterium]
MANAHFVVSYDIPGQKRRTRLFKRLSGMMTRIQYSVFEGLLDSGERHGLLDALAETIDPDADRIVMYQLCACCSRNRVVLGRDADAPVPGESPVVIV